MYNYFLLNGLRKLNDHHAVNKVNTIITVRKGNCIRGMAGKFVDTISIFNKKRNSIEMNISGFAKIFHEQIDEILLKSGQHDIFYSLLCAPP